MYNNIFKEIFVVNTQEEILIINTLNNKITNKNKTETGRYNFKNDILDIYWDNLTVKYSYKFINDKYYNLEYLEMEKNIFILIDKNKNTEVKINYFNNYLYFDDVKYTFIKDNYKFYIFKDNRINYYILQMIEFEYNEIYYILINNEIYNCIDNDFNYLIYREFNPDLENLKKNIELYLHWINNGIHENRIYSIKSFMNKNIFFNFNKYSHSIITHNDIDIILHFNKNKLTNSIYHNDNIEIIYNNLLLKDELHINQNNGNINNYDNDNEIREWIIIDEYKYEYEYENNIYLKSNLFHINYFEEYYKNIINILFIINIENINDLEKILLIIPINLNIIININIDKFNNNDISFIFNNFVLNFKKIIFIKSKNQPKYYIIEYIYKKIIKNKINFFEKIIYINNYLITIDDILNIDLNRINNNKLLLINDNKIMYYYKDINYLYYLLNYAISKIDLIQIIIFYYIIKKNIYDLFNNNFIINIHLFKKIMKNIFSKKICKLIL